MKLILLDPDPVYRQRFLEEFPRQAYKHIELTCLETVEEVRDVGGADTVYLLHESLINGLINHEAFNVKWQGNRESLKQIKILSEGIVEKELERRFHDLIAEYRGVDYRYEEAVVHKYQRLDLLIGEVLREYLYNGEEKGVGPKKISQWISVYTPYNRQKHVEEPMSFLLEHAGELVQESHYPKPQLNILVIDYNCHHLCESQFTLSTLFTTIRKGQQDFKKVLEHIVKTKNGGDYILPPIHMRDVDCLNKPQFELFLKTLKHDTKYDYVIFNFENVHITAQIEEIMNASCHCYLNSFEEHISERMALQYPFDWKVLMKETSLREAIYG